MVNIWHNTMQYNKYIPTYMHTYKYTDTHNTQHTHAHTQPPETLKKPKQ